MAITSDPVAQAAIAERYDAVRERIVQACQRAGRRPDEVSLVAVTKTFPLETIRAARELGIRDFGENRARELRDKARELPGVVGGGGVRWHMLGHLQTNKAKYVARHADAFLALDSERLAEELDGRAARNDRILPCLVQVDLTGKEQRYGVDPASTHAFLDALASYEHLRVEGLMGMAAHADDPEAVRPSFRQLRELFETYRGGTGGRVRMETLSMGMSNDFEVAVEEGATQLRLGSVLFGARDYGD